MIFWNSDERVLLKPEMGKKKGPQHVHIQGNLTLIYHIRNSSSFLGVWGTSCRPTTSTTAFTFFIIPRAEKSIQQCVPGVE